MTLEPIKIPQNVYVEDRIIGPITLRQLIILGIGCGVSYAMYSLAVKTGPISIPLTIALWVPGALSFAVAFVKINDLSLFHILLLYIEHFSKPSTRVWVAHPGLSINILTKSPKAETEDAEKKVVDPTTQLAEMTRQLQHQQEELSKLIQPGTVLTPAAPLPAETAPEPVQKQSEPAPPSADKPEPVNPERIQVSPKSDISSVDGLSAFQHLFPS